MPLTVTLGTTTATSQVLNFAGYVGTDTIRIQYSMDKDFGAGFVSPTYDIAVAAAHTMQKLNQSTRYFARARLKHTDGSLDDWIEFDFYTPQATARNLTPAAVMIEPARIIVPEKLSLMSANNVVAGFPVDNIVHDGPTALRMNNAGSYEFRFALNGTPIDTIAILSTNLPADATIVIVASNSIQNPTSTVDFTLSSRLFRASPDLPGRPGYHGIFDLGGVRSYKYWEIRITASCPGNVAHIGHVIAGLNRATQNHKVEKNETPIDYADFDRTRDGNPIRTDGLRGRRVDFDVSMVTEAQYESLYADLWYRVGTTDPVLVIPNGKPGSFLHDRILYGTLPQFRTVNPVSPRYSLSLSIDSII